MSRRRFSMSGTSGATASPVIDPIEVQKANLAAQRENLSERKFAQQTQDDTDRLSLSQESNLLRAAQTLLNVTQARQAIEDKREATIHAAAIIDEMGDLNVNDANYERQRANILSQHAAGLTLAEKYVQQKDSVWEAQQKANLNKTNTDAEAVQKLAAAAKNFGTLAASEEGALKPVLQAAQATATLKAIESMRSAPAATAALGNTQPSAPSVSATPPPAAPANTSTATAVATDDATKFLQSIGVGAPAPAQQPAAQSAQAVSSGLPDTADAALSAAPDSEEEANNNQDNEK